MEEVRVRLRGGPEDGQEINVTANPSGIPAPRVTLRARTRPGVRNAAGRHPPLLIYERHDATRAGAWEFHYVGAEADQLP